MMLFARDLEKEIEEEEEKKCQFQLKYMMGFYMWLYDDILYK